MFGIAVLMLETQLNQEALDSAWRSVPSKGIKRWKGGKVELKKDFARELWGRTEAKASRGLRVGLTKHLKEEAFFRRDF